MHFPRLLFVLFVSVSILACNSNSADEAVAPSTDEEALEARIPVWDVAPNPEGVAIGRGVIYATHFGPDLKPTTQDGDGYIAVYDANGGFMSKLVTELDAPKGVEVVDSQVFVADIDTLFGFSTEDGSQTFAASFTGKTNFLNGLVAADDASLFISATDAGKIWKVDQKTTSITLVAEVPSVNGLALSTDGSVLYAVQYDGESPTTGRLLAVNPSDGSSVSLGTYGGLLDGVFEHNGAVYFTDWNPAGVGKVLRYDLVTQKTTVVIEDSRLQGPADFEVLGDGLALIPCLTGSRILGVHLN